MMTRKHYRETAETLNAILKHAAYEEDERSDYFRGVNDAVKATTRELAAMFKRDNPRFDRERFIDAVYKD